MKKKSRVIVDGYKLRIPLRFKAFLKNGEVLSYSGTKKSQIRSRLEAVPAKDVKKYSLRVIYGKAEDNFGKITTFDNEGEWETRGELFRAMTDFTERDLLREWL